MQPSCCYCFGSGSFWLQLGTRQPTSSLTVKETPVHREGLRYLGDASWRTRPGCYGSCQHQQKGLEGGLGLSFGCTLLLLEDYCKVPHFLWHSKLLTEQRLAAHSSAPCETCRLNCERRTFALLVVEPQRASLLESQTLRERILRCAPGCLPPFWISSPPWNLRLQHLL